MEATGEAERADPGSDTYRKPIRSLVVIPPAKQESIQSTPIIDFTGNADRYHLCDIKQKPMSLTGVKQWTLKSPEGEIIIVENLSRWLENNIEQFGGAGAEDAERAYKKFREIARLMRHGSTRRKSYHGWRLVKLPETVR